jgi:hypothetical protein
VLLAALCGGCCLWPECPPPTREELATPELAWQVFQKAASERQAWRAYCCFSIATQEQVDYFDFYMGMRKKKWRKAFDEMVITTRRRLAEARWEYWTNYKEPFHRFEIVYEEERWKVHIPEEAFEYEEEES